MNKRFFYNITFLFSRFYYQSDHYIQIRHVDEVLVYICLDFRLNYMLVLFLTLVSHCWWILDFTLRSYIWLAWIFFMRFNFQGSYLQLKFTLGSCLDYYECLLANSVVASFYVCFMIFYWRTMLQAFIIYITYRIYRIHYFNRLVHFIPFSGPFHSFRNYICSIDSSQSHYFYWLIHFIFFTGPFYPFQRDIYSIDSSFIELAS